MYLRVVIADDGNEIERIEESTVESDKRACMFKIILKAKDVFREAKIRL